MCGRLRKVVSTFFQGTLTQVGYVSCRVTVEEGDEGPSDMECQHEPRNRWTEVKERRGSWTGFYNFCFNIITSYRRKVLLNGSLKPDIPGFFVSDRFRVRFPYTVLSP